MGKEFYFETDDRLDRKKYAEFLKTLLEHCDEYRREDSDGAYVIAIDSPWGTGKTRFAKMFRNFLEDRTKKMGDDSVPGDNASFSAIYYNSWETDFSDDALLPLIYSITKSPEFKMERFNNKSKQVLGKFLDAAAAVAKISAYTVLHNIAGEKVVEMIEAGEEALTQKASNPLEKYEERLNLLNEFRRSLENAIKQTKQKKLVIVVDELDRCRPTFAIQSLELAKHLFAVPNLVFIFALDIEQLSYSVKTVYGTSMDASGYLCRFFDYIGKLPDPDTSQYIKSCLSNNMKTILEKHEIYSEIVSYLIAISKPFALSLRDISTIIKTYQVMLDSFLGQYKFVSFHRIYLFLITLKYKKVSLYTNFLLHSKDATTDMAEIKKHLPELPKEEAQVLSIQITRMNSSKILNNVEFDFCFGNITSGDVVSDNQNFLVEHVQRLTDKKGITFYQISTRIKSAIPDTTYPGTPINFSYDAVLSHVLDHNDLQKWTSIKDMSLGHYYFQQLEMFNFALPSDDPAKPE